MKLSDLSEAQLSLISEADRAKLGISPAAAEEKIIPRQKISHGERKEHATVMAWIRRNRLKVVHASTIRKVKDLEPGWPDFTLIHGGRSLLVEMKVDGGESSPDQVRIHAEFEAQGDEVYITWSADQTIRLMRGWMWEHFRWVPEDS